MRSMAEGPLSRTKRLTLMSVLTAMALGIFILEAQLPSLVPIPGVKLGLANLVILVALRRLDTRTALLINLVRIALAGLLFGTIMSLAYSLAGGLLSFLVMWALLKTDRFSLVGVSLAGGAAHNIGQILVAMVLLSNARLVGYLPVLLLSGVLTGAILGLAAEAILRCLPKK